MFKIAEIFGPTIQGEGPYVGSPCAFVRFGGCDYRCVWCDSMHAVLPEKVRELPDLDEQEILQQLRSLENVGHFEHVVLSGGNPLLWNLTTLVRRLSETKFVHVETQGTVFKEWLGYCDVVTVSPKPPSSEMGTDMTVLQTFWNKILDMDVEAVLKIVVFDLADYRFALNIAAQLNVEVLYISVGTRADDTTESLLERYQSVIKLDQVERQTRRHYPDVRILPQMHVLLWGHKLGV